jgi:outer membrane receptor protein involved in Fe transport
LNSQEEEQVFEEVIVTAEKRDESLQDVSQAVTAITENEIEAKILHLLLTSVQLFQESQLQRMKVIKQ